MSVEVIGGGGGGGATSGVGGTTSGAGGGAGAYSKLNSFSPTGGSNYTATVGAGGAAGSAGGDSSFSSGATILAKGGSPGVTVTPGNGGAAGSGVGDTKYSGGNGGAASGVTGGGGGGGAGSNGNGGSATTTTAGTGTTVGGGNGGAAGAVGSVQGGAGGGASALGTAGAGARGYVVLTYNKNFAKTVTETQSTTDSNTRNTTLSRTINEYPITNNYSTVVLADTPLLYWRLDETGVANTQTFTDSSGNSRPATYFDTAGNAAKFEGQPGVIKDSNRSLRTGTNSVPYRVENFWTGNKTFEGWYNRDSNGTILEMFWGGGNSNSAPFMYAGGQFGVATDTVNFSPNGNSGGICTWLSALPALHTNFHIVLTFNDTSKGTRTSANNWNSGDNVFRIGCWLNATLQFWWNGLVDEVAIYNGILSSAQILAHYNAGANSGVATDSNSRIYTANRTQTETVSASDSNSRIVAFNRTQTETTPTFPADVTITRGGSTFTRSQSETTPTAPADVTNTRTAQFNRTQTEQLTAGGGTTIKKNVTLLVDD
jgi:hypothetical protein